MNPINNYGVNVNIGNYVSFSERYKGKGGVLDVNYWVLPHQKDSAFRQFKEVSRMMEAFEYWFAMPIRVTINGKEIKITPNEVKQTFEFSEENQNTRG